MAVRKIMIQPAMILIILLLIVFESSLIANAEEFNCQQDKHDFTIVKKISPTAAKDGHITYRCRICGLSYTQNLYATGHEWSNWVIKKEPTCTKQGQRIRACHVGTTHSETREIPAKGHIYKETTTSPNCKRLGKHMYTCKVCSHSYSESFGKIGAHHYIEIVTKEPVCEHEGLKTFTCDVCGNRYTEHIPALRHIYGDWMADDTAREGRRYKECTLCGHQIRETIPALPKPLFGITEVAVVGANIAVLFLFFGLLAGEFAILKWERSKKKKIMAKQLDEKNGDDGYELI